MMNNTKEQALTLIGSTELVEINDIRGVPAKIDTGADSSSIWASNIQVTENGVLEFCLFSKKSPFYTGEIIRRTDYKVAVIRSASGHEQIRYRTHFYLTIGGRKIRALFNLSDRSKNNFPVLVGRRTISGKFLVDVSKNHTPISSKRSKTKLIQYHFKKNPHNFHQKFVKELSGDFNKIKERDLV